MGAASLRVVGLRFGCLTAIEPVGADKHRRIMWRCGCNCGGETTVASTRLRRGRVLSCGCLSAATPLALSAKDARRWQEAEIACRRGPAECWPWQGALSRDGYGSFSAGGTKLIASRVAWVFAHGDPDPKLKVCHRCDNPRCVNPAHLFLGTSADNQRDCAEKGRSRLTDHRGSRNPGAKLTAEDVLEIRRRRGAGELQATLAKAFGVAESTVFALLRGQTWASLRSTEAK